MKVAALNGTHSKPAVYARPVLTNGGGQHAIRATAGHGTKTGMLENHFDPLKYTLG